MAVIARSGATKQSMNPGVLPDMDWFATLAVTNSSAG
jgi:hypothetical protein